jgi:hypothetical protein
MCYNLTKIDIPITVFFQRKQKLGCEAVELVNGYQHFENTCCLQDQDKKKGKILSLCLTN